MGLSSDSLVTSSAPDFLWLQRLLRLSLVERSVPVKLLSPIPRSRFCCCLSLSRLLGWVSASSRGLRTCNCLLSKRIIKEGEIENGCYSCRCYHYLHVWYRLGGSGRYLHHRKPDSGSVLSAASRWPWHWPYPAFDSRLMTPYTPMRRRCPAWGCF